MSSSTRVQVDLSTPDMSSSTRVQVDLSTPDMTAAFRAAPVYRKSAIVTIRTAQPGERVTTVTGSNIEETIVTCYGGEPVITNPGGEQYIPTDGWDQVSRRYDSLGDGRYQAKGLVRAFTNPTGQPVAIDAPWGERQEQEADCLFAVGYQPEIPDEIGPDRYLIGANEFRQTYQLAG